MKRLEIKLTLDVEKYEDLDLEVLNLLNNNGYNCVKSKVLNEKDVATTPDEFEYVIIDEAFIKEKLNIIDICNSLKNGLKTENNNLNIDVSFKNELFEMYSELIGTVCITGYLGDKNIVKIPKIIDNLSVTTIGNSAFNSKHLEDIELPNTLIYIGSDAFSGANIYSHLIIPKNVKFIDCSAFQYNRITELTLPNTLIYIGNSAFAYNEITNLEIPNSVKYIGRFAFQDNSLSNVKLPDSIEIVLNNTFFSNELEEIKIPNSVKYIENNAFSFNNLITVILGNDVEYIGESGFSDNSIENLTLSKKLKIIKDDAFSNNKIVNLEIPSSLTTLSSRAFHKNPLKTVIMPSHLIEQKDIAFNDEYSVGKFYSEKLNTKFIVIK